MLDGILDRRLGDFIEHDAAVFLRIEPQDIRQMPGNRLALAIRVTCEIDFIRILGIFFERLDEVALATDVDVFRLELVIYVDAELALRQIAQMSH